MIERRGLEAAVELGHVPFFPQAEYQCGPAALGTALASTGLDIDPDALISEVYLPARKGSLQPELLAAVRRRALIPYVLPPSIDAVLDEVSAGRPVVVLQNLGLSVLPVWHYAVFVGYDADRRSVVLRSGTTRRLERPMDLFWRTWARAGSWAFVVLAPGELPARPDAGRFLLAASELERLGHLKAAERAYRAAGERWPADGRFWFALGNVFHASGRLASAVEAYAQAAAVLDEPAPAYNNSAYAYAGLGCWDEAFASARSAIDRSGIWQAEGEATLAELQAMRALDASVQRDRAPALGILDREDGAVCRPRREGRSQPCASGLPGARGR